MHRQAHFFASCWALGPGAWTLSLKLRSKKGKNATRLESTHRLASIKLICVYRNKCAHLTRGGAYVVDTNGKRVEICHHLCFGRTTSKYPYSLMHVNSDSKLAELMYSFTNMNHETRPQCGFRWIYDLNHRTRTPLPPNMYLVSMPVCQPTKFATPRVIYIPSNAGSFKASYLPKLLQSSPTSSRQKQSEWTFFLFVNFYLKGSFQSQSLTEILKKVAANVTKLKIKLLHGLSPDREEIQPHVMATFLFSAAANHTVRGTSSQASSAQSKICTPKDPRYLSSERFSLGHGANGAAMRSNFIERPTESGSKGSHGSF